MAVGRALGAVAAPGPAISDLVLHRLVEHGEAGSGRERQQPLPGGAGDLGERELDFLRQRPLGCLLGRGDLAPLSGQPVDSLGARAPLGR